MKKALTLLIISISFLIFSIALRPPPVQARAKFLMSKSQSLELTSKELTALEASKREKQERERIEYERALERRRWAVIAAAIHCSQRMCDEPSQVRKYEGYLK